MFESQGIKIYEVGGVPVSVSVTFLLLVAIVVGFNGVVAGTAMAAGIFLSVLVHEYGHALVALRFRLGASILIHGLGGLCFHRAASSDRDDALILAAGPLLEIAAGGAAIGVMFAAPEVLQIPWVGEFVVAFAYFSIVWGLINLFAPIYPLDGGRLFHLLLRRFMPESSARTWALRVSLGTLVLAGLYAGMTRSFFLLLVIFMLAMDNYQALQSGAPLVGRGSGRAKPMSDFGKELLREAEAAFAEEDWREAARLCHQLRASVSSIPAKQMNRVWEILGLATAEMGEPAEALEYLKRAPDNEKVREARARCERALAG
jgi:Zn-dependent protease